VHEKGAYSSSFSFWGFGEHFFYLRGVKKLDLKNAMKILGGTEMLENA